MLVTFLKSLKRKLQWTGWLQYLPIALLAVVLLLVALFSWVLGSVLAAFITFFIGLIPFVITVYDICTVKLKWHPQERLPVKRYDDLDLFDLMRLRHSCRSYQNRKITPEARDELVQYVQSHTGSPNCNLIGTRHIRFEYVNARLTVWPTVGAQEFLVAIAPKEYDRLAVIDVGRCLQNIVMYATRMGLSTSWIGPGADHKSILGHLGDRFNPEEDHIICVCAIGYESKYIPLMIKAINIKFHRRLPLSSLFFTDSECTKPLDVAVPPFNRYGRCYEICQWAPSSFNSQTTRCVAVLNQNGVKQGQNDKNQSQLERFDFYQATNSHFYAPVALGIWCANWEMGCNILGIKGHFSVLTAKERGVPGEDTETRLPRYDVSWLLDSK